MNWKKILKIAGAAGLGAAGAVTGGATWTAIPTLLAAGTAAAGAAGGGGGSKAGSVLGGAGEAIGKATSASGANRLDQEKLALQAHQQNLAGKSQFEQQLLARAEAEDRQRQMARRDAYRASVAGNLTSSPYNPRPQTLSPQFLADMGNVGTAASSRLIPAPTYSVGGMAPLAPYEPLDIKKLQEATGTQKGKLEKIGDWAGPISSVIGQYLKMRGAGGRPDYSGGE